MTDSHLDVVRYAVGLVAGIRGRETESMVLAILVAGKLVWEQLAGPLPGSESASGGAVIVDAHLYGAMGGVLATLLMWRRVRTAAPAQPSGTKKFKEKS